MTAEELAFELFKHLTLNESYVGAYQGSGQIPGATVIDGDIDLTALAQAALDAVQAMPAPVGEPVGWMYDLHDGSQIIIKTRLTDEQKANGYWLEEDDDDYSGNEDEDGPNFWTNETPLYAASVPSQEVEITDEMVEAGAREWFGVNTWDQKPPSEREFYIGALRETILAALRSTKGDA